MLNPLVVAAWFLGGGFAPSTLAAPVAPELPAALDVPATTDSGPVSVSGPVAVSPGSAPEPTALLPPAHPPAAPAAPAGLPVPEGLDAVIDARRREYEGRLDEMGRARVPSERPVGATGGIPDRPDVDRYVEERQREVDARFRAADPWGQRRRERLEDRRQIRRDALEYYRAVPPPALGAYPWGPLAPYYGGAPWSAPMAPRAPTRGTVDDFFERQHRAIEEQFHQFTPWPPYRVQRYAQPATAEERALRENPWANPWLPDLGP
jgi:hypothetical protein